VIIKLILQNQLTFCTWFWRGRTWKWFNIKRLQDPHAKYDTIIYLAINLSKATELVWW